MSSQLTRLVYRGLVHKTKQFEQRAHVDVVAHFSRTFTGEGSSEIGLSLLRRRFRAQPRTSDNILQALRFLRVLATEADQLPTVFQKPILSEGSVFVHKITGRKGVVCRCDPYCKETTNYVRTQGGKEVAVPLRLGVYQPFYAVCLHGDDRAQYLPQEELAPAPTEKLENAVISTFLDYVDGAYTLKDARRSREKAAKIVATSTTSTETQATTDSVAKENSDTSASAGGASGETNDKKDNVGDSNTLSSLPVQDTTKMETRALPK